MTTPPLQGLLTDLTALDISGNNLAQTLPTELGSLTEMAGYAKFYSNSFSGTLPSELGRWSKLRNSFHFYANRLTGTVLVELFAGLAELRSGFSLYSNSLAGNSSKGPTPAEEPDHGPTKPAVRTTRNNYEVRSPWGRPGDHALSDTLRERRPRDNLEIRGNEAEHRTARAVVCPRGRGNPRKGWLKARIGLGGVA